MRRGRVTVTNHTHMLSQNNLRYPIVIHYFQYRIFLTFVRCLLTLPTYTYTHVIKSQNHSSIQKLQQ